MATTPKLQLPLPGGGDIVSRAAYGDALPNAIDQNAASQAQADQPFHLDAATYDSANNRLVLALNQGQAVFPGLTLVSATSATVYIATPATNASYYLYVQSTGSFVTNTTGNQLPGAVLLWKVTTGASVSTLTTTDLRGKVLGAANAPTLAVTTAATYTVLATDLVVIGDTTSNAVQINLPPATGSGRILWLRKSATAYALTIHAAGSDTLDESGTANLVLAAGNNRDGRILCDTGTGLWRVLQRGMGDGATLDGAETFWNKTFSSPLIVSSGATVGAGQLSYDGTTQQFTQGDGATSHYVVTRDAAETLSNKTLSNPAVTGQTRFTGAVNTTYYPAAGTVPTLIVDNQSGSSQNVVELLVAGVRRASVRADSNGNLVLSPSSGGATYLSWDEGNGIANFGNGAGVLNFQVDGGGNLKFQANTQSLNWPGGANIASSGSLDLILSAANGGHWVYFYSGPTQTGYIDSSGNLKAVGDMYLGIRSTWLSSWLNQPLKTTDSPTFGNVTITGLGALSGGILNQSVKTTDSPTFAGLSTTNYISAGRVYSAAISLSANWGLPNSWGGTAVPLGATNWDNGGFTGPHANALTAPVAGTYIATATATFANNGTGNRGLWFSKNGVNPGPLMEATSPNNGGVDEVHLAASQIFVLNAGDYIGMMASQDSGGTLNLWTQTSLQLIRIGA